MSDEYGNRWSEPIAMRSVRNGRLVGEPLPEPLDAETEARIIRDLNETEIDNGRETYPDTDWVYQDPLLPPAHGNP